LNEKQQPVGAFFDEFALWANHVREIVGLDARQLGADAFEPKAFQPRTSEHRTCEPRMRAQDL